MEEKQEKESRVNPKQEEHTNPKEERQEDENGVPASRNSGDVRPTIIIKRVTKRDANIGGAIVSALIIVLMLVSGYFYMRSSKTSEKEVSMTQIVEEIRDENVKKVTVRENRVLLELKKEKDDTKTEYAYLQGTTDFFEFLQGEGISLSDIKADVSVEPVTRVNWVDIISLVFMILLGVGVFLFVRNMQGSGGKLLDFGQSRARLIFGKKTDVGFDDVAGIKESKEELQEIVLFLKNPKRFTRLGARIPKGVLLVGPPGSGKTLLARAVAGEAAVPFFHTSGSEFEEMLVGAGASRVRDLFLKARKAAPCIIFIDEIDAVAKKRGTTLHSGNTEQTLNQILVEMDGLEPRTNVIVIAATNRPDVLDPAILRPGRFDRHISLSLPDASEREAILKIHAKNKKIAKSVDYSGVARRTIGFSGADLENALNEAAIMAAKSGKAEVSEKDIQEAALKVRYGPERRSKKREEDDIKMAAYHEAGHALVARYIPHADPVFGVSIISRGGAGGLTMFMPEKDRESLTKKQMAARISVSTGGNVAEKIVFDDTSTGASADIKTASDIARDMVKRYGMSDKMGFVQYGDLDELEYLGYGYERKDYSDETARDIDMEVHKIVSEAWRSAEVILRDHKAELDKLVELLLEKEVLDATEFKEFFEGKEGAGAPKKTDDAG
jgi:cell division protease FtsH